MEKMSFYEGSRKITGFASLPCSPRLTLNFFPSVTHLYCSFFLELKIPFIRCDGEQIILDPKLAAHINTQFIET